MLFVVFLDKDDVEVYTCKYMNEVLELIKKHVVRNNNCVHHDKIIECSKDYGEYVKKTVYKVKKASSISGVRVYRIMVEEYIVLNEVSIRGNREVLGFYVLVSNSPFDVKKISRWLK